MSSWEHKFILLSGQIKPHEKGKKTENISLYFQDKYKWLWDFSASLDPFVMVGNQILTPISGESGKWYNNDI